MADDFISKLPEKSQAVSGELGSNIYRGQQQKLAIARDILNYPPLLVLEESNAGIDRVSKNQVLDQVLFHRQSKTTILISHRHRVTNRADWIVPLDGSNAIF